MTNGYDILDDDPTYDHRTTGRGQEDLHERAGWIRPALWVLLVIFLSGNAIASLLNVNILIDIALGMAAVAAIAGLIVDHYRRRRP
jgi:hypothetical protein